MYLIKSETTDPFFNLALDEFLLKKSTEEFIVLGINSASVISGKHQCIHKEINTRFITERKIPVLRRITGGGTVFHDEGNLNYTFILNSESGKQVDFPKYTRPVLRFLDSIGIRPEMQGSDIKVKGRKISGNAEHIHRNRVLHHGTLLFDASLDNLSNCLRKDGMMYETKAVASNPSPVTNISELKPGFGNINDFRALMAEFLFRNIHGIEKYDLNEKEKSEINDLVDKKYNTWEWNFAYGPEYFFSNSFRLNESDLSVRLHVREGIIRDIVMNNGIIGIDFLSKLKGIRHMPEELRGFFNSENFREVDIYDFF